MRLKRPAQPEKVIKRFVPDRFHGRGHLPIRPETAKDADFGCNTGRIVVSRQPFCRPALVSVNCRRLVVDASYSQIIHLVLQSIGAASDEKKLRMQSATYRACRSVSSG